MVDIVRQALILSIELLLPLLLIVSLVSLAVGVFQAATQIQDPAVAFPPRLFAAILAAVIFGPWLLSTTVHFTSRMLNSVPTVIRQQQ
jgi:flagellar biosynthetic protein FliQ